MGSVNIEQEGVIITLKPSETGSISHTFKVKNGRATLLESPHRPDEPDLNGLSFNVAAELDEVSKLIDVLKTLCGIMSEQLEEQAEELSEESEDEGCCCDCHSKSREEYDDA